MAPESLNAFTSLGTVPAAHKWEVVCIAWNRQTGVQKQCVAAINTPSLGAIFFDDRTLLVTDYCKTSNFEGMVLNAGDQLWVAMLGASAGFCPVIVTYIDVEF
jgi:hypothetical protein